MKSQTYRPIQVRDCQGTLWAFYRQYEGTGLASFEGDLSSLDLHALPGSFTQETAALKRQTLEPEMDFIVVPITTETIGLLKQRLSKAGALGEKGKVIHTQLEANGVAVLIACDNFHDDCTVASSEVSESFLSELKTRGVLRA